MEIRENRHAVIAAFRDALARDKTRTQVFDISDLGLVEMTRKRIGEGLLESFAARAPTARAAASRRPRPHRVAGLQRLMIGGHMRVPNHSIRVPTRWVRARSGSLEPLCMQ
jgi:Ribonuclease G/E